MIPWTLLLGVAGLSGVLTALIIRLATRYGWVERPKADRWHRRPTARFGGVALFVTFTAVAAYVLPPHLTARPDLIGLVVGATLMFGVGLIDDIRPLNPQVKLVGQMMAIMPLMMGEGLHRMSVHFMLGMPVVFLWVLGLANAFNLLDNMDGLSAGVAGVAAIMLGLRALGQEEAAAALLCLGLTAACAGFLYFNLRFDGSARIFMGDCGSMFLGYLVAGLATVVFWGDIGRQPSTAAAPLLIAAVPLFDTVLVIVRRRAEGRPITQGGKDHTSHRLVYAGCSERGAVVLLYALTALTGLLGLWVGRDGGLALAAAAVAAAAMVFWASGAWLSRFRGPQSAVPAVRTRVSELETADLGV